jgi:hypothetical protein
VELSWRVDAARVRRVFVGWGGGASRSPSTIEIDVQFCQSLDFKPGQLVRTRLYNGDVPTASMVVVEPCSSDDWEILVSIRMRKWRANNIVHAKTRGLKQKETDCFDS